MLYFVALYCVFYIYPNLFPIWEPQLLPLLSLDLTTPLIPWTFLLYLSDYLLAVVIISWIPNRRDLLGLVRNAFGVLFVCGTIFLFWPTTYPRPEYPIVSNPIVYAAMELVRSADRPTNCFPSMHVALTTVLVWEVRNQSNWIRLFFLAWGGTIFITTLTTKQHYFWDIIGGVVVSALVIAINIALGKRGLWERLKLS